MAKRVDWEALLANLPAGLSFNAQENAIEAHCDDCGATILYEIRQRNIREGPFYCKKCAQKHRKLSDEARQKIADGAKKRMGPGPCTVCGKYVETFRLRDVR